MQNNNAKLKIPIIILSIFLGLFCFAKISQAATYYVSTSGDDRNAGTDPNYPWAHCPGMIGWGGSATLIAGDIVYFASQDAWSMGSGSTMLTLIGGVTYDGATWGTGTRAKLTHTGTLSNCMVSFRDDATHETVFKGFELDGQSQVGGGVYFAYDTGDGLIGATKRLQNCVIHHISYQTETAYSYSCLVSPCGTNKKVYNVEILDNTIYTVARGGIDIYPCWAQPTGYAENILIRGNTIYDAGISDSSSGWGIMLKNHSKNVTVEFNTVYNCKLGIGVNTHTADQHNGPENAIIRYNIVRDINKGDWGSGLWFQDCHNCTTEWYGNIVYNNNYYGIRVSGMTGTSIAKFYNNILYNNDASQGSTEIGIENPMNGIYTLEFENNIISSRTGKKDLAVWNSGITLTHNNNIYYRPDGGVLVDNYGTTYTSSNITSWDAGAQTANPSFKNTSNLPTGFSGIYGTNMIPDADGLSIFSGPALNNGTTLTSPYNGAINFSGQSVGLTRPQGAGWDIGAYEYVQAGDITPPSAPSGVTVN